jgi:choline dehydrogenase-like flavoprotein
MGWSRGKLQPGLGADFKTRLRGRGEWVLLLVAYAESLPRAENRITLDPHARDPQGLEQVRIEFTHGPNERTLLSDAQQEARAMVELIGGKMISSTSEPGFGGTSVHEMGGARMGRDPNTSVVNGFNQTHDVANLFVTDGACMASSACQNPSLTYMALTARACDSAVTMLKQGAI